MVSRDIKIAVLAVVSTMDECREKKLPVVASSVHMALQAEGYDPMHVVRIMELAGIIRDRGNVLEPGEQFEHFAKAAKTYETGK